MDEGWLVRSEMGLALLYYLSKEANKGASNTNEIESVDLDENSENSFEKEKTTLIRLPSCLMGILSRSRLNEQLGANHLVLSQPSLTDPEQEFALSQIVPQGGPSSFWSAVKHMHHWTVRLHGDGFTGKTALSLALCRLQNEEQMASQTDTPGLVIRECLVPVKLVQEEQIRWVRLELEDVGSSVQSRFSYLKYDIQKRMFHVHIVLLSMTDSHSLESARDIIKYLTNDCGVELNRILAVASKVDEFQSYQITDSDLQEFVSSMGVALCLVNNHAQFGEQYSTYSVVEELARIML